MSTIYNPTPSPLVGVYLPSDGENLSAASVNPALEGLADGYAWLIDRAALAGAQNFPRVDTAKATTSSGTDQPLAICSTGKRFIGAFFNNGASTCEFSLSADGVSWISLGSVATAGTYKPRAIAAREDGWVVAGRSTSGPTSAARKIDVRAPAGTWDSADRSASLLDTNYHAAVFAGTKAFLFGVRYYNPPGAIGGQGTIVSADVSSGFLTWATVSGASYVGGSALYNAERWDVAALGTKVVAMPLSTADDPQPQYAIVDAVTNLATTTSHAMGGTTAGLVVWRGLFWAARSFSGPSRTDIYSSADGLTWTLRSSIAGVSCAQLVPSGRALLVFQIAVGTAYRTYGTIDGTSWQEVALTVKASTFTRVAWSENRAAILELAAGIGFQKEDLRVSLGAL